jgi:hypothetical protein
MRKVKGPVPDGRVFEIRDINADTRYLHPEYEYLTGDRRIADDDRLIVFELRSKKAALPSFSARWDGGNRSVHSRIRYDLDIDILDPAETNRFKNEKDGYHGHHTIQVGTENKYIVDLKIPVVGLIFDATITFSRHHNLLRTASSDSEVTVTTSKRQPSILEMLKGVIMRSYQLARSSVRLCC